MFQSSSSVNRPVLFNKFQKANIVNRALLRAREVSRSFADFTDFAEFGPGELCENCGTPEQPHREVSPIPRISRNLDPANSAKSVKSVKMLINHIVTLRRFHGFRGIWARRIL